MRAWALGLSLFACGRVDSAPNAELPTRGEGGSAQAARGAADPAAASGASPEGPDTGVAHGGASGVSDAAAVTSAGSTAAIGGGGAGIGSAGSSVGGSADDYEACGCGCCGEPVNTRCYYPELGDALTQIIAQDRATADSADCATKGCESGTRYVRCETAAVEAGAAYTLVGYADSKQHLKITRQSQTGRCTGVLFQVRLPQPGVVLELPKPGPGPERADDGPCGESADARLSTPIGWLGSVTQPDQSGCVFDFDYTLFFLADDGAADGVRFRAEGVEMAGCK